MINMSTSQQQVPGNVFRNLDTTQLFRSTLSNLQKRLIAFNISEPCLEDNIVLWSGLSNGEMWAMQMIDASGKLPSGLLGGNVNWIGSYDECVNTTVVLTGEQKTNRNNTDPYGTQYCQVNLPIPPTLLGNFADNPQAAQMMAGGMVGVCIPSSCSVDDAAGLLAAAISMIPNGGDSLASQMVSPKARSLTVCQGDPPEMDAKAKAAISVCAVFVVLFIMGTVYDVILIFRDKKFREQISKDNQEKKEIDNARPSTSLSTPEQVILSFSIYTNVSKLLNTKQGSGSLTAINGIRFFSMTWVVIGHTYPTFMQEIGSYFVKLMTRFTFQTILNATVSTDSFFVLSGLLVGYLSFREMKKLSGIRSWCVFYIYYYFHRFWRLTPVYMLLMLIYISLWPYVGDGPVWTRLSPEPDQCRNSWWKGMLYINNFFPREQCMGWVWYLANDMQMYWFSPLIITPLFFSSVIGGIVACLCLVGTSVAAGVVSYKLNISAQPVIGAGNVQDWFDYYYVKPYCRIGPYIVGIITGYILYRTNCQYKMKTYLNLLGWAGATILCLSVLYGTNDIFQGHPFTMEVSALYNALHRTVWGIGLCWLIFACATGNGGPINTFLSWSAWVPLARLTYCTYMVHLIVIQYVASTRRSVRYWTDIDAVYNFLGALVLSLMAAFVLSVSFEAPMVGLEKTLIIPHLKHKKRK
ncbi:hypothetical protein ScPMuIL_010790 [Solemya velum]